jgi:hypothetical protein
MKQCDLDSLSVDELFMLHERLSATLAAKITAEKEALVDRLKQARHARALASPRSPEPVSHDAAMTG